MDTQKLRKLLTVRQPDEKLRLAEDFSLCYMLFNVEVLKHYSPSFYGDEAEQALQNYFKEEGLTGRKHPLAHCAVFRGDVMPQLGMQLAPMMGLPFGVSLFAYVFAGAKDHDWEPMEAKSWVTHELAEYCFGSYVNQSWEVLLRTLIPKGYYSKLGKFTAVPT